MTKKLKFSFGIVKGIDVIMEKIILASASPRRKELLEQIGISFEVIASNVNENITYQDNPDMFVEQLALMKAQEVARRVNPGHLIIGADTIVLIDNEILGKPENEKDAFDTIKRLSGKSHFVFTGIAIIETAEGRTMVSHAKTKVIFRDIQDDEILAYIKSGEPDDKAGSYGIQGKGAVLVEGIDGCYFNIVGLPIACLCSMLKSFGVEVLGGKYESGIG
jgi:septum formation protein